MTKAKVSFKRGFDGYKEKIRSLMQSGAIPLHLLRDTEVERAFESKKLAEDFYDELRDAYMAVVSVQDPPTVTTKTDFVSYLRETLVPDLHTSGQHETAFDFETCLRFMDENRIVINWQEPTADFVKLKTCSKKNESEQAAELFFPTRKDAGVAVWFPKSVLTARDGVYFVKVWFVDQKNLKDLLA